MVELWLVDLERAGPALHALEADEPRLSADDRARARRAAGSRDRLDRTTAYIALRIALERIAGHQTRGVNFKRATAGKPRLGGGQAGFSLSHSDGFALLGVTRLGEIGVDLERARSVRISARRRDLILAAGQGLVDVTPAGGTADPLPQDAFLQAWVRLEAFAKAHGGGLARVLTDIGIRGDRSSAATPARIATAARRLVEGSNLQVRDLRLPSGLRGALALASGMPVPRARAFPTDRSSIAHLLTSRRVYRGASAG